MVWNALRGWTDSCRHTSVPCWGDWQIWSLGSLAPNGSQCRQNKCVLDYLTKGKVRVQNTLVKQFFKWNKSDFFNERNLVKKLSSKCSMSKGWLFNDNLKKSLFLKNLYLKKTLFIKNALNEIRNNYLFSIFVAEYQEKPNDLKRHYWLSFKKNLISSISFGKSFYVIM